jgi:hypothetical protein
MVSSASAKIRCGWATWRRTKRVSILSMNFTIFSARDAITGLFHAQAEVSLKRRRICVPMTVLAPPPSGASSTASRSASRSFVVFDDGSPDWGLYLLFADEK